MIGLRPSTKHPRQTFPLFVCGLWLLAATTTIAKPVDPPASQDDQATQTLESFESCRRSALDLLKREDGGKRRFKVALIACRENFPGADLYIGCKKQALQTAKSENTKPDQMISQCRRYLTVASFGPDQPFPVFTERDQAFFAGIGLNRSHPLKNLSPPNFNCNKIKKAKADGTKASFVLIGNHPNLFAGFANLEPKDLADNFGYSKPYRAGLRVNKLGMLFGDPRKDKATLYFAAAPCKFKVDTGKIYGGIDAYYLLDPQGAMVTPYFGIAYYRKEQQVISTAKLVDQLQQSLGEGFQIYNRGDHVTFVSATELTEIDEEKDPKNLCRSPRRHQFLGIVHAYRDQPARPEYLILANVKNLCEFGDRVSKKFAPEL
ncbi:MAG: hypothetical protein FJ146_17535 [Deltaproteobacteria bacterium]|nr:hypothetical protein [Deltaproteobacteria bacterium]